MGRRTSRTVNAVDEGSGSSTTSYWYGKALVPLVVVRDGVTYRMIGGLVIEERVNGEAATQYYPHRDYTSSVRVVTDGTGAIAASLGYNGDWGWCVSRGRSMFERCRHGSVLPLPEPGGGDLSAGGAQHHGYSA